MDKNDLELLELEAEAIIILQKQQNSKGNKAKVVSTSSLELYNKAKNELPNMTGSYWCEILEKQAGKKLSNQQKQEYISMLINDPKQPVLKKNQKILHFEYTGQAVYPRSLNVSTPKTPLFKDKVLALAKYSTTGKSEHEALKYVYHDNDRIVASDAYQLVVVHVAKRETGVFYDKTGGKVPVNSSYANYENVIPERNTKYHSTSLKDLLGQVKACEKANKLFHKKFKSLAIKLLFKIGNKHVFINAQTSSKALSSLWLSGCKNINIHIYPEKNLIMYCDAGNEKTFALETTLGGVEPSKILYIPIIENF